MAQANEYDVMLLDLMMPGTDGFAVVDTLRRTAPELLRRCVIVTAVGPRQFDHLLPDVFRIIRKPFELADLLEEGLVLRHSDRQREARRADVRRVF